MDAKQGRHSALRICLPALLTVVVLGGCVPLTAIPLAVPAAVAPDAPPEPSDAAAITPRMLIAPGALVGPGPSSFLWTPSGAMLAYIEPVNGQDVLWLYDAATGEKRVLLNPAEHPDSIDVTSAQWSPQGDRLLLAGDEALWLLDVKTGDLKSLAEGGERRDRADVHARRQAHLVRAGQRPVRREHLPTARSSASRRTAARPSSTAPGLGLQRGAGDPRGPAGLRLVARRRLADLPAPGRERRAQRPGHRLRPCAGHRQLHPLSDGGHGEPNRHAPRAGPGRDSRRRWRSRCPPAPNTCCRSSPGRRTPITRSSSP